MAVIFVVAFALFTLFAWMAITAARERAEFYRGCYQECLDELQYQRGCQASDSETISRMSQELDRRRMEAKHAEYLLQDEFERNRPLQDEFSEDRKMTALESEAFMTTGEDLFGEKIMRSADEAARLLGCREEGMVYCGELPDHAPECDDFAIFEDGTMVRGEYPEATEAIVAAGEPGDSVRHYQHLL